MKVAQELDFKSIVLTYRPNQFLMCPTGWNDEEAHELSPEYLVSAAELTEAWGRMIDRQPRLEKVTWDKKNGFFDLVQRSALLRFPDRITAQIVPLAKNRSTLAIYSRSTYGYSDLGVNKARVEGWLRLLDQELDQS